MDESSGADPAVLPAPRSVPKLAPLPVSPSMLLLAQGRQVEERLDAGLVPLGLSLRKVGILGHLASDPGRSFTELARRARITVQSVHVIVGSLLEDGVVEATSAGARGRSATLALTALGRERLQSAREVIYAVDAEVFGPDVDEAHQEFGSALRRFGEATWPAPPAPAE